MNALLPRSVFNIKFGINLRSQEKESALSRTAAVSRTPGSVGPLAEPAPPSEVMVPPIPGWKD